MVTLKDAGIFHTGIDLFNTRAIGDYLRMIFTVLTPAAVCTLAI